MSLFSKIHVLPILGSAIYLYFKTSRSDRKKILNHVNKCLSQLKKNSVKVLDNVNSFVTESNFFEDAVRRRKASAPGAMESTENLPADTFQSASTVVHPGGPGTDKSKPNVTFKPTDDDSSVKGQGAKIDKVKSEHSPDNCESAFFTPSGSFEGLKATNSPLSSISETESQDRQAKGTGSPQEMAEMSESPRRLFGRTRHKSDGSSPAEQRDVLASVQEILVEEDRDWKRVRKS